MSIEPKPNNVKKSHLSNEEKLALMKEYMQETGKKVTAGTVYKGYNIGAFKSNLRASYRNESLKMDEDLLKKFIEAGIITEKRERKERTSPQEKYDFLMSTIGKDPKEVEKMKMSNGMKYKEVIHSLQEGYKQGDLHLEPEQIENLKRNEMLEYTQEDYKKVGQEYKLPGPVARMAETECGSFENFVQKYRNNELSEPLKKEIEDYISWCQEKTKTFSSEKERTLEEIDKYIRLARDISRVHNMYVNIDKLEERLNKLRERERKVLKARYGIGLESSQTLEEVASDLGSTRERIRQIENKGLRILEREQEEYRYVIDISEQMKETEEIKSKVKILSAIKEYITKVDGTPKEQEDIENIDLAVLGITDISILTGKSNVKTMYDLLKPEFEFNSYRDKTVEDIELSGVACGLLKRAKINTVEELLACDDERLRRVGSLRIEEIMNKLEEIRKETESDENNPVEQIRNSTERLFDLCDKKLAKLIPELEKLEEQNKKIAETAQTYYEFEDKYNYKEFSSEVLGIGSDSQETIGKGNHVIGKENFDDNIYEQSVGNAEEIRAESIEELEEKDSNLQAEIEEMKRKIELEKRRQEKIASIKAHQKELEELKKELAELNKVNRGGKNEQ